jgi:hypothetical protein
LDGFIFELVQCPTFRIYILCITCIKINITEILHALIIPSDAIVMHCDVSPVIPAVTPEETAPAPDLGELNG